MNFNKENLSPSAITKEMQDLVITLPNSEGWQDYFEGGAGRTVIELIAGSQAIKNHYNLMRVREGSLQYAKLESSITELALNKGVHKLPAKTYIGTATFTSSTNGVLLKGEEIGSYEEHKIYAYKETYFIVGTTNTVDFIIGNKREETVSIDTNTEFSVLDVLMKEKYITGEFQYLTVNGEDVVIVSEQLNLYDEELPNSCLRIVYENRAKLIFGDDIIGKMLYKNDEISFKYMTFSESLISNFSPSTASFNLIPGEITVTKFETLRKATSYIDKENLRLVAMRNSIDGRWVLPQDYRSGLLKEFSEYMYDILVIDSYPTEKIYILEKEYMINNAVKDTITELIDSRRGNAVLVEQFYIDPLDENNYQELSYTFNYVGNDSDEIIQSAISEYKDTILFKFRDGDYIYSTEDIVVDLTKLLPQESLGKFYEILPSEVTINKFTFIKTLDISYT